jgi:hypothetical protein
MNMLTREKQPTLLKHFYPLVYDKIVFFFNRKLGWWVKSSNSLQIPSISQPQPDYPSFPDWGLADSSRGGLHPLISR